MFCDHRETTGWCIIQQLKVADEIDTPMSKYWVMYNKQCKYWKYCEWSEQDNDWYPHGVLNTYQKALKRLELIENGTIEPW